MCKLVTIIKKNNDNDELIIKAVAAQEKVIRKEPHGIAALAINKDTDKVEVKKDMDNYDKVLDWAYSKVKNSKVVSIHSRQATSGVINKDNLHFFKADEYYLAHNGVVSKCSDKWETLGSHKGYFSKGYPKGYGKLYEGNLLIEDDDKSKEDKEVSKDKMCDSYKFLTKIKKPMTEKDILNEMASQEFYGVGIVVDTKKKILYTFATRSIPMHTNMKDFSITYSFDPTSKIETTKRFMGFELKGSKKEAIHLHKEKAIEGVYKYHY